MKKTYLYLIAFMLPLMTACVEEEEPKEYEQVAAGGYDSMAYAKKMDIGKHEYYLVYASCDGRHSVRRCKLNHGGDNIRCFLIHSPDCFCRKTESAGSIAVTGEAESTDPFDW